MSRIFVSYRRSDSKGFTGALVRELSERFHEDEIFLDVQDIDAGEDFVDVLDRALSSCSIVLVVMGERWASVTDTEGRPRLDDPEDFVRREVIAALSSARISVIPVLVGDARMPAAEQLPEDLAALTRRQAVEIGNRRWDEDVERLVGELREELGAFGGPTRKRRLAGRLLTAAGALLILLSAGTFWLGGSEESNRRLLTAVVDEVAPLPGPDSPRYSVVFKHTEEDGTWRRYSDDAGYEEPQWEVGDEVELSVDPTDPGSFEVVEPDGPWLTLVLLIAGALATGAGVLVQRRSPGSPVRSS